MVADEASAGLMVAVAAAVGEAEAIVTTADGVTFHGPLAGEGCLP